MTWRKELHVPDLRRGRRAGVPSHRLGPDRVETHLGDQVDADPPLEHRQVSGRVGPLPAFLWGAVEYLQVGLDLGQARRRKRCVGEAVGRHEIGSDPLAETGLQIVATQQGKLRV